ncbi:MAG: NAD(P)H-dependent oxidoreductase subunit E [Planctomycetes bacterium]|nr:NAD(P)H-dependent oxidoreductase subunit E [Planctomycetota bacterium]
MGPKHKATSRPSGPPSPEKPLAFSNAADDELRRIVEKYPDAGMRLLPTLHVAQREFGWISEEVKHLVAHRLAIPVAHLESVVSFYTMFHQRPVGRLDVQVCMSLPCALRGSGETWAAIANALGIAGGEITADGLFSICKVECLAQCDRAPVVQVNDEDHLDVSADRVKSFLDSLRNQTGDGKAGA